MKKKKTRCPDCGGPANKNGWVHKKDPIGGFTSCRYYGSPRKRKQDKCK